MTAFTRVFFLFLSFMASINCQTTVTSPENKIIKLFDKGFFTEGPAYSPDGNVFFSDITFTDATGMEAGIIWKCNTSTGKTELFRSPSGMSNGIEFDPEGNMVVCEGADYGGRKITITNMKTGRSKIISGLYNSIPYNAPNDLVIDKNGNIYFTDPKYAGWEKKEQPCFGVYKIDIAGKVDLIIDSLVMPNGIALSPDNKKLYIAINYEGDTEKNISPDSRVVVYDLTNEGQPINGRNFLESGKIIFPDGLTVDKAGNVYIAVRDEEKPGIYIYNKEAELLDIIDTPEVPSNLTFGKGKDNNILFITAGRSLYKIKLLSEGI